MTEQGRQTAKELARIKLEIRVLMKQLTGKTYLAAHESCMNIQDAINELQAEKAA
jgi:hypothetical protein